MASDKITIDGELFERLTHAAIELEGEWHWKAGIQSRRYGEALKGVQSLVREAVAIRDAPPQAVPQRAASHPTQPVVLDENGTPRFLRNAIVEHLVDSYPGGLNELACKGFTDADFTQLAQLIGYSTAGFGELSYVSDEAYAKAIEEWRKINLPATGASE